MRALPASVPAFFARRRKPLLLGGGLALLVLLGLLLTNFFLSKPGDSGEIAAPTVAAKPSRAALPFPAVSTGIARRQIKFVTCLCRDKQGCVWIGTEDAGLWRYDPDAPVSADYVHFAAADGPGDDTVYALACDKSGRIWAGTLNHGVAVFNGRKWGSYAPPNGPLGYRIFALAVNPISGGVWMATEAGLVRYEQKRWTYYTQAAGLVSDHATSLAFAPNGTLYIGTECDGIAVGSLHDDYKTWRNVPGPATPPAALRGTGLPSGLVNCLDVTPNGEAWAGTTAGLAHSSDGGRTWQFRRGGDWKDKAFGRFTSGYADFAKVNAIEVIPAAGSGAFAVRASGPKVGRFLAARGFMGGYPSGTTRPVDTAHAAHAAPQEVYRTERYGNFVFTASHQRPRTLCKIRLHFTETFHDAPGQRIFDAFINNKRVLNHFDIYKAAGAKNRAVIREFTAQTDAAGRLQIAFKSGTPGQDSSGLGEDYVTYLADDGAGHLLVGHRQQAPEAIDLKTGRSQALGPNAYVNSLLPLSPGTALAGVYSDGLSSLPVKSLQAPKKFRPASKVAALPISPSPPTLAQMNQMLAEVRRVRPDPSEMKPHAAALADDWRTQGDWLGRYGRYWAALAAFFHPIPEDYVWGAGWEPIDYRLTMGPSHSAGDSLRYWMQWRYTDNPRVLEMPAAYTSSRVQKHYTTWSKNRRETEVDDHGEDYPPNMNGPNIYATLTVPDGLYYLSLYDYNKDGHDGDNRNRDYRLSVRVHSGLTLEDVRGFSLQPELAHGRIRGFWGGVYKRFLVRGPVTLAVEVNRNASHNAILPAVLLDLVDEAPAPYFRTVAQGNARAEADDRQRLLLTRRPAVFTPARSDTQAASLLFDALNEARLTNSVWWATEGQRYYAPLQRWYANARTRTPETQRISLALATCEYQLGDYPAWEKSQQAAGLKTARQIEQSLRWDGVTNSYSGLGCRVVSASHSGGTGRKVSQAR